jgi:hypothetical protein
MSDFASISGRGEGTGWSARHGGCTHSSSSPGPMPNWRLRDLPLGGLKGSCPWGGSIIGASIGRLGNPGGGGMERRLALALNMASSARRSSFCFIAASRCARISRPWRSMSTMVLDVSHPHRLEHCSLLVLLVLFLEVA